MSRQQSYGHVRTDSTSTIEASTFSSDSERSSNENNKKKLVKAANKVNIMRGSRVRSNTAEVYDVINSRSNDRQSIVLIEPEQTFEANSLPPSYKNKKRQWFSIFSTSKSKKSKQNDKSLPVASHDISNRPTELVNKKVVIGKGRCCLIILFILLLLGNLIALDIFLIARLQTLQPQNITSLISNPNVNTSNTNLSPLDLRIKSVVCLTLLGALGSTQAKEYPCEFCTSDPNVFYNVTSFCVLKGIWANANQTAFETSLKWMGDNNFCKWGGVKCDSQNNIIGLDLVTPNIPSTLSNDIGKLTTLQTLTIVGIGTLPSGPIPSSIFQLQNLIALRIASTALTGQLPNTFDKMNALTSLTLKENTQLGKTLPSTIGSLSLNSLAITGQGISGAIPDFIGDSNKLQLSLQSLDLSSNALTGLIPASLMQLSALKILVLGLNKMSGPIPPTIGASKFQKTLTQLDLGSNSLTDVLPDSLSQFASLQFLYISKNQINGNIPTSLSNLLNLKELLLNDNKLSGPVPDAIGNLQLKTLSFARNGLTGIVPISICQQSYTLCDLTANNFTATAQKCGVCSL